MVFSSLIFVFVFLPVIVSFYYLLNDKLRNSFLFLVSIFFYAWGETKYFYLILLSIAFNYAMGLVIAAYIDQESEQKGLLFVGVTLNLLLLFTFKYEYFFVENLRVILGEVPLESMELPLPIGISFFTFQAISYLIDVSRQTVEPQRNLVSLGLYIAFFPQLIAGPIVRYASFAQQITQRVSTYEKFTQGIRRFILGFSKKIIFANQFSLVALASFATADPSFVWAWVGAIAYTLQIYFDFSGYSDMAIGLGKMFGFDFQENFRYPYCSRSISEFWRRWHISLGAWFRDYVYIPLGGSHVGPIALLRNLFIVWFLTGFWHGAAWNFLAWGLMYFVLIALERLYQVEKHLNNPFFAVFYGIFVMVVTVCGWVVFGENSLVDAHSHLNHMFQVDKMEDLFFVDDAIRYLRNYGTLMIWGMLLSTPLVPAVLSSFGKLVREHNGPLLEVYLYLEECLKSLLYMIFFLVAVSYLVIDSHNPFIYQNF